jgi:hypothetical protein
MSPTPAKRQESHIFSRVVGPLTKTLAHQRKNPSVVMCLAAHHKPASGGWENPEYCAIAAA